MRKALTDVTTGKLYYIVHDSDAGLVVILGPHGRITGNYECIWGNCTNVSGLVSHKLSGDVSGLSGRLTGVTGCSNGLAGSLDDCDLTDEDRSHGVNIRTLVNRSLQWRGEQ